MTLCYYCNTSRSSMGYYTATTYTLLSYRTNIYVIVLPACAPLSYRTSICEIFLPHQHICYCLIAPAYLLLSYRILAASSSAFFAAAAFLAPACAPTSQHLAMMTGTNTIYRRVASALWSPTSTFSYYDISFIM